MLPEEFDPTSTEDCSKDEGAAKNLQVEHGFILALVLELFVSILNLTRHCYGEDS
jgi:hypothetical protein